MEVGLVKLSYVDRYTNALDVPGEFEEALEPRYPLTHHGLNAPHVEAELAQSVADNFRWPAGHGPGQMIPPQATVEFVLQPKHLIR
ncbi:hypothetical protein [Actinophytocola sp.]|uniref:hypothetical protein n=1 Tax=Actinophytocola sp. TaxID=1872138 RepID=UPI00389A95A3